MNLLLELMGLCIVGTVFLFAILPLMVVFFAVFLTAWAVVFLVSEMVKWLTK